MKKSLIALSLLSVLGVQSSFAAPASQSGTINFTGNIIGSGTGCTLQINNDAISGASPNFSGSVDLGTAIQVKAFVNNKSPIQPVKFDVVGCPTGGPAGSLTATATATATFALSAAGSSNNLLPLASGQTAQGVQVGLYTDAAGANPLNLPSTGTPIAVDQTTGNATYTFYAAYQTPSTSSIVPGSANAVPLSFTITYN